MNIINIDTSIIHPASIPLIDSKIGYNMNNDCFKMLILAILIIICIYIYTRYEYYSK